MASQPTDVRLLLSEELKAIRSKIVEEKLVLFVGEQVSTLVSPENPHPSLDDWWKIVDYTEVRLSKMFKIDNSHLTCICFWYAQVLGKCMITRARTESFLWWNWKAG